MLPPPRSSHGIRWWQGNAADAFAIILLPCQMLPLLIDTLPYARCCRHAVTAMPAAGCCYADVAAIRHTLPYIILLHYTPYAMPAACRYAIRVLMPLLPLLSPYVTPFVFFFFFDFAFTLMFSLPPFICLFSPCFTLRRLFAIIDAIDADTFSLRYATTLRR